MSFYESELYDLVRKYTSDDICIVAAWVAENLCPHPNAKLEELSDKLHYLQSRIEESGIIFGKAKDAFWKDIEHYYINEILPLYPDGEGHLNYQSYRDVWEWSPGLKYALLHLDEYRQDDKAELRQKLYESYLLDPEILASDLLEIATDEYNKKIVEAKVEIMKFTEPHRAALEKVNSELEKIENALKRLPYEKSISIEDREIFECALVAKKDDLSLIRDIENNKSLYINALLVEIKRSQERFRDLLIELQKKRDEMRVRKDYMALVEGLEVKIPRLKNQFQELSSSLFEGMSRIRDSFLIVNMPMTEKILGSLTDQSQITSILGSEGRGMAERIVAQVSKGEISEAKMYDLSFLENEYDKK